MCFWLLFWKLSFQFCIIVTDTCINIEGSVESFELIPWTGQRLCAAAAAASPPATDCLSNLPAPDTAQGATWQQHQLYARSAPPAFLQQKKFGPPNGCLHEKIEKRKKRVILGIDLFTYL